MPTRSFTEVIAWQKAHAFVRSVYLHTASFPPHELLAKDIEYINNNIHNELNTSIEEASKVLNAYYASVENSQQG